MEIETCQVGTTSDIITYIMYIFYAYILFDICYQSVINIVSSTVNKLN